MENETNYSSLISLTQALLSAKYNSNIETTFVTTLPSQFIVLRLQVKIKIDSLPQNIIVKQIISVENPNKDPAEIDKLKTRFRNEIASLKFLANFPKLASHIPNLLAYDIKNTILILDDKGTWPSLMTILNSNNYAEAYSALLDYAKFFANLHGHTFNKKDEFYEIQKDIGAITPPSDSNSDIRKYLPEYKQFFKLVSSNWEKDYEDLCKAFDSFEDVIVGNREYHSFIHCDSGPQNVLCTPDGPVLLDFEFGGYGFSLLDIVGQRIAFQQSMKGLRVPQDLVYKMEDVYLTELYSIIGDQIDYSDFKNKIYYAQAHWVLGRLGYFIKSILNKALINKTSDNDQYKNITEQDLGVISKMLTLLMEFKTYTNLINPKIDLRYVTTISIKTINSLWQNIQPLQIFESLQMKNSFQEKILN